jgi:Flp pilus assembly protein TadD
MSEEFDRAVADHRAGKLESAAKVYRRLLDGDPEHADAWHLLGLTLHQRGQNELAIETIRRALLLNPRVANYHNSFGLALHGVGDAEGAAQALQTAVTIDAGDADAHNNLGMVFTDLRRFEEAERTLRKSLSIRPDHGGAIYNLGRVLVWRGEDAAALRYLQDACAHDPENSTYWNTLGVALDQVGDCDDARAAFEHAIEIDQENIDAHVNLAHNLLNGGESEAGWREHEWRLRRPEFRRRMQLVPWCGEDISGKTILLWAEQGLGDAIHFARFAPHVAARGARVILEAPDVLHDLLGAVQGVSEVVSPGYAGPRDAHAALMSLPKVFGNAADLEPYLAAPSAMALDASAKCRVGLVWAGNPGHSNDRNRSYQLAQFEPLCSDRIAFYSLQVGPAAGQQAPAGMRIESLGARFGSFSDTASAIIALDLLVTVDTSVAHLAGALGAPVFLILPPNPDWRWGREGDRTPWYPSMRLFRQARGEDKRKVVERVARALADDWRPVKVSR